MCTMISTFRGIRTRLEFTVPSQLCLERNNEFLTCPNPSQCGISLSTSLWVSLLLSVATYDTTKNHCSLQYSIKAKGIRINPFQSIYKVIKLAGQAEDHFSCWGQSVNYTYHITFASYRRHSQLWPSDMNKIYLNKTIFLNSFNMSISNCYFDL